MFNLDLTPYLLDPVATDEIGVRLRSIEERVALLRSQGALTEETLKSYYGEKRFEQVAESNALEGSTLSIGETELAVLKGITTTGHDPAYVRDAIALDKALSRLAELAKAKEKPTDIHQLHDLHGLLLGERAGAGIFRNERVLIRGSKHTPPKTWEAIMEQMETWEQWSKDNLSLPAPLRAAILHAWLAHIHPFIDGNGRAARAVSNLELIRAGYPPIIIKKKEKDRYIQALAESDEGGDIRSFIELIFDRIDGALGGLERSAQQKQGYDPVLEMLRSKQRRQLNIWETSCKLLAEIVEHRLVTTIEPLGGQCYLKVFEELLELDDYLELCNGRSVAGGWAFIVSMSVPGVERIEKLAYMGHRSSRLFSELHREGGPSLYWSSKNPSGFPKWIGDVNSSPFAVEMTTSLGDGDTWIVRTQGDGIVRVSTTELGTNIAAAIVEQAVG